MTNFRMPDHIFHLSVTFLLSTWIILEAESSLESLAFDSNSDDSGEKNTSIIDQTMELPETNNSFTFILKSNTDASRLMLTEQGGELIDQDLNQHRSPEGELSGLANNESYLRTNEGYRDGEFDYVIRDKRDGDDSNASFYNDSVLNGTDDDMLLEYDEEAKKRLMETLHDLIFPKTWTWFLVIFHTVVFVIGIVGNILVCVAVYRNHTMRTVTNYFIVNLAVADFLVILFCLPPSVVWDVSLTWFFGIVMCKIVLYLQSVSVTVSVLTLTFISIDRWYAICFPLRFRSTTGRAKTAIGIIWIVALACDIPEMMYVTTVRLVVEIDTILLTQCVPTWSHDTDTIFVILKMICFYWIPLLFMSIAYIQIIRVLWKSGNVPHQIIDVSGSGGGSSSRSGGRQVNTFAMNMNASTEGQLRSRRKAAKMLVAVVVMFAFCYFPVHLLSILRLTVGLKNNDGNRAFSLISHWLCYANSAVNPIIYNFMSGKFRKEFHRAFEHCCQRTSGHGFQFNAVYRKNKEKDSVIASRSNSRTDMDIHRVNTYDFTSKHARKGTKTSMLNNDA